MLITKKKFRPFYSDDEVEHVKIAEKEPKINIKRCPSNIGQKSGVNVNYRSIVN